MRIIAASSILRVFNETITHSLETHEDIKQNWRCHSLDNGFLTATNEYSLFTKVIKIEFAMQLIDVLPIIKRERIDCEVDSLAVYRYENKRVTGSINDIKRISLKFKESEMEKFEELVNRTPFKYLGFKNPNDVHFG